MRLSGIAAAYASFGLAALATTAAAAEPSPRVAPAVPRNHKHVSRQHQQQQIEEREELAAPAHALARRDAAPLVVSITNYANYTPDPTALSVATQAMTDPVGAAKAADAMPFISNNNTAGYIGTGIISGDSDEGNGYPWSQQFPFVANADATGSPDGGWNALPPMDGFTLNRSITIRDGAIQPVYITADHDPQAIKRAIIVMPGKPRDSWKYTNLIRNALTVQAGLFPEWGISNTSVLIMGPAWLNQADQTAGAVLPNELVFHGTQWQSGGNSVSPNLTHSITTYECLDRFTDILFDKTQYPNLNQVVVAGHSMGGQMVQRYALLKKTKKYDQNMQFWAGNPGSWAWLTDDRPYQNTSCEDPLSWHYGIGGNQTKVSKYARDDVITNRGAVVNRFLARKMHYALGLLDNGAGDTHCQAGEQGGNHLDRGSQFAIQLGGIPASNGWPANHTLDYVVGVSHQDYAMMSWNASLQRIFYDDYNQSFPLLKNTTNPGDHLTPKPKAFATPLHTIVAAALLGGSVGGVILAFALLPFLFGVNTSWQEQERWRQEELKQPM